MDKALVKALASALVKALAKAVAKASANALASALVKTLGKEPMRVLLYSAIFACVVVKGAQKAASGHMGAGGLRIETPETAARLYENG